MADTGYDPELVLCSGDAPPGPARREKRLEAARKLLRAAGADFVIDSVAEFPGVVEQINRQLGS